MAELLFVTHRFLPELLFVTHRFLQELLFVTHANLIGLFFVFPQFDSVALMIMMMIDG